MTTIKCTNDEWPIYEAYSLGRGWLFHLLGGGWRKTYSGKMAKMCKYIEFGRMIKKNYAGW